MTTFGQITLIKRSGEDSGIVCPVTAKGISIGRDFSCQIRVQMPRVSRQHCQVAVENNKVVLKNLSKNSISINASKLARNQTTPMRDGDVFQVIDRSFRYNTHLSDKENIGLDQQAPTSVPDGNSTLLVETCPVTKQRKISIEVPHDYVPPPRSSLGKRARDSQGPEVTTPSLLKRTRKDSENQSAQPMTKNVQKSLSPLPSLDDLAESPFHQFSSGWADKRASAISFIDLDSSLECPAVPTFGQEEDPDFIKDPNIAIKEGDAVFQVGQLLKKQVGNAEVFTARTPKAPTTSQRPSSILRKPHTPRRMDAERVSFAQVDKVLLTPMNRDSRLSAKLYVTPSKTTSPATRTDELPILRRVPDEFLDDSEENIMEGGMMTENHMVPSFLHPEDEEEDEEEEDDYISQPGDYDLSESINPSLLTSILARRSHPEEEEDDEEEEDEMDDIRSPQQDLPTEQEEEKPEAFAVPTVQSRPRSLPQASPAIINPYRFRSVGPAASQQSTPTFAARSAEVEEEDLVTDQELEADQMLVASNTHSSHRTSLKQLDLDPLSPSESECTPTKAQPTRGSRSTGRGKQLKAIPFSSGPKRAVTPLQARERVRRAQSDAPMPLPMALPSPKASQRKPVTQHVATPVARPPAVEEDEEEEDSFVPPVVSLPAADDDMDTEEQTPKSPNPNESQEMVEDKLTEQVAAPEPEPIPTETAPVPQTPEAPAEASAPQQQQVPYRSGVHVSGGILAKRKRSRRSSTCFSKTLDTVESPPSKRVRASMAASIPTLGLATPPSLPAPAAMEDGSPLCGIPVDTASPLQELPATTPQRKSSFSQTISNFLKTPVRAFGVTLFSGAQEQARQPALFALWKELRNYLRESTDESVCRCFYETSGTPSMTEMYDRIHSGEYQSIEQFERDWQSTFRAATSSHTDESMHTALATFANNLFEQARESDDASQHDDTMDGTIEDDLWNVKPSQSVVSLPSTPVAPRKSAPSSPAVVAPVVPPILHTMMEESLQVPEPSESEFFSVCSESFASPAVPRRVSDMHSTSADSAPATPIKAAPTPTTSPVVEAVTPSVKEQPSPAASPVTVAAPVQEEEEDAMDEEMMEVEPSESVEEHKIMEEPVSEAMESPLPTDADDEPSCQEEEVDAPSKPDEEEEEEVKEEEPVAAPVDEESLEDELMDDQEPSVVEEAAPEEPEAEVSEKASPAPVQEEEQIEQEEQDDQPEEESLAAPEVSELEASLEESSQEDAPMEEDKESSVVQEEEGSMALDLSEASELKSAEEDAQSSIDQEAEEQLVPDLSADEASEEDETVMELSAAPEEYQSAVEVEAEAVASDSESELSVDLSALSPEPSAVDEASEMELSEVPAEFSEVAKEASEESQQEPSVDKSAPQSSDDSSSELIMELSEVTEVSTVVPEQPEPVSEDEEEEEEPAPKVDYNSWTCVVLRKELKSRQLDTKGLKRDLVKRLEDDDAAPTDEASEASEASPEVSESAEPSAEQSEVAKEASEESSESAAAEAQPTEESSELSVELSEVSVSEAAPAPKVDYNSWTCVVLRKELKKRKLDTKGLKKDLVQRLEQNDLDDSASSSPTPVESAPAKKSKAPAKSKPTRAAAKKAEPAESRPRRSGRRR